MLFISVPFAAALTGPTEWLAVKLHVPRAVSGVGIYPATFTAIGGIGWLVVPP